MKTTDNSEQPTESAPYSRHGEPLPEATPDAAADPQVEQVVSSLLARALATVDLTTATVKLAAAEMRLAVSSAGLIIALVAILLVMVLVTWLVLLATVFAALQAMGLSALLAALILLVFQLAVCGLLAYTLIRLGTHLSFPLTRQALRSSARSFQSDLPEDRSL